jgi:hypothetical protein
MRALSVTTAAMLLVGCATETAPPPTPRAGELIGHWRRLDPPKELLAEITFAPDGTFSARATTHERLFAKARGKWTLQNNTLYYEYTSSSTWRVRIGTKDRDRILDITKDYFVVQNIDGERHRWNRFQ